jgi:hypothetical protein
MRLGKTVENRLHRECGKKDAEHSYNDLTRGKADQSVHLLGEQHQDKRNRHYRDDRRNHRRKQAEVALRAGGEHDGARHRAGACK